MEQFVRVRNEFDAHHKLTKPDDRARCLRDHGHHWVVEVEKIGKEGGLEDDLADLLSELSDRSLNEMLPGLDPTPEQMSISLTERLLLHHPTIVMVSFSDGRVTGITRNTPR